MNPVWIVVAVAILGVLVTLVDLAASATFRRLATRSISRRRGEAVLIVVGAMFGTAIIGAALIVGDSFDGSNRDVARTELGPVDLVVTVRPDTDARRETLYLEDKVAHAGIAHLDGLLPLLRASAVLDNGKRGADQQIDTTNCLAEVDFASARRFGPDPAIGGLADAGTTPTGNQAVLGAKTAGAMGVREGDKLIAHLSGRSKTFVVRTVVPMVGLAGFCGALVAPGTLDGLWANHRSETPANREAASLAAVQGPNGDLLVSLDGGVFDSVRWSAHANDQLEQVVRKMGITNTEVTDVKARRIDTAQRSGSQLRSIFSGIGGFSVISGVLLLVNLVIMLAEERKVEFGLLRAVGFKRAHLLRSFSLEGSLYSMAATVLGAVLGVGIAGLVIAGTQSIFADPHANFRINLFVHFKTLALAAAFGYAISIVTVWLASARVARLNIISSIRDLPDPRRAHRHTGRIILASLGVAAGGVASAVGILESSQVPLLAGVPVAAFCAIALVSQLERSTTHAMRTASFIGPVAAIVWILGVFTFFSDEMNHAGIAVFVIMGVLLVAAAVIMAVAFAPVWGHAAAARGGSFALSCRLGFAYPLARSVRTGLILAMFSLVIFTMVFMASLAATIDAQATTAAHDLDAGYDILVDANLTTALSKADLGQQQGIESVTTFLQAAPTFTNRYQPANTRWSVSGFDSDLLRYSWPALSKRMGRFATDKSVFVSMLQDPQYIVVDDNFLLRGGGPKSNGPEPGDKVVMTNIAGHKRTLIVAGVLKSDAIGQGSLWSKAAVEQFLAPAIVENRAFLRMPAGSSRTQIATTARRLAASTVTEGTEVSTFEKVVTDELSQTTSFMRLLEGYLGFGLLIGIAGLGVVMVRAARERRHEIGTLRAMGLQGRVVSRAFLIEAFFIAAGGVTIGTSLALITAYQVVVNSSAFSVSSDSFTIAWVALILIAVVPTAFALAAAGQPARAVGRIRPAVALRIAD